MSPTVLYSPDATSDMSDIWDYTVEQWGIDQAELYVLEVAVACKKLADGLSHEVPVDYISLGYRKMLVGKHVVFFIRKEQETTIVRILHQSMDVSEI